MATAADVARAYDAYRSEQLPNVNFDELELDSPSFFFASTASASVPSSQHPTATDDASWFDHVAQSTGGQAAFFDWFQNIMRKKPKPPPASKSQPKSTPVPAPAPAPVARPNDIGKPPTYVVRHTGVKPSILDDVMCDRVVAAVTAAAKGNGEVEWDDTFVDLQSGLTIAIQLEAANGPADELPTSGRAAIDDVTDRVTHNEIPVYSAASALHALASCTQASWDSVGQAALMSHVLEYAPHELDNSNPTELLKIMRSALDPMVSPTLKNVSAAGDQVAKWRSNADSAIYRHWASGVRIDELIESPDIDVTFPLVRDEEWLHFAEEQFMARLGHATTPGDARIIAETALADYRATVLSSGMAVRVADIDMRARSLGAQDLDRLHRLMQFMMSMTYDTRHMVTGATSFVFNRIGCRRPGADVSMPSLVRGIELWRQVYANVRPNGDRQLVTDRLVAVFNGPEYQPGTERLMTLREHTEYEIDARTDMRNAMSYAVLLARTHVKMSLEHATGAVRTAWEALRPREMKVSDTLLFRHGNEQSVAIYADDYPNGAQRRHAQAIELLAVTLGVHSLTAREKDAWITYELTTKQQKHTWTSLPNALGSPDAFPVKPDMDRSLTPYRATMVAAASAAAAAPAAAVVATKKKTKSTPTPAPESVATFPERVVATLYPDPYTTPGYMVFEPPTKHTDTPNADPLHHVARMDKDNVSRLSDEEGAKIQMVDGRVHAIADLQVSAKPLRSLTKHIRAGTLQSLMQRSGITVPIERPISPSK